MKNYDLIVIGTGSVMNVVDAFIKKNPESKIAVIDKDKPGGICLTRGCIPSKILLYPAEMIRHSMEAKTFGIDVEIKSIDFELVMNRMRNLIGAEIDGISRALYSSKNIDYFRGVAEFTSPYTLKVNGELITSGMIFLGTGSAPAIPEILGLDTVGYLTSDTILNIRSLPKSVAIIGGGYIAAEYGHFLSAMGSNVTIIGRNQLFLPQEEPEISRLAKQELERYLKIMTNQVVIKVEKSNGKKKIISEDRSDNTQAITEVEEILVAAGRNHLNGILHPERSGIKTTTEGWIEINEYLETSKPGIWALGDAKGKHLFKHVANYESEILYYNAILGKRRKADYSAIPHAVFTYPEIASVGMRESEAIQKYGNKAILIGYYEYENTAKGKAMNAKNYFVKLIIESKGLRILGGHIIGPYASQLIHDIIIPMYTKEMTLRQLQSTMYIHPALDEVVQRAASNLMSPEEYHSLLYQRHRDWA